ncbi:ABC transporter ATP-binding protein [Alicyclobacillus fodiniaquatilis]|jgi:peptide/nickel transport system ATP-binding protein|uniref:ABC transporter ATP-binding protein n=1 Tax=Alicyclobacillus fodiniaquatilis TaxID=1661150 RepID=A0ABW4JQ16_9BACL
MSSEPLLRVENVSKHFKVGRKILHAVQNASFQVERGQTIGLVGESGSGKSTLGRTILRLLEPDSGTITFEGVELNKLTKLQMRSRRQDMQMIFQDALASLSPRMTVGDAIEDPLLVHRRGSAAERAKRVEMLLERVGLSPDMVNIFPFELSGGQQQRVGIARALALQPKLIVCDEAVSALDVSIQIQIINLLQELQEEFQLSYIFISHNLSVVEYLSDYVVVMYLGQIVENAPVDELYAHPHHPYTRVLMDSVLEMPEPGEQKTEFRVLAGEIPSPLSPPSGCPFHPRCPMAMDICATQKPVSKPVGNEHYSACHLDA